MQSVKHSVLVITYNQEHLISRCLESILNQNTLPYEIIIGDDCSTDGTWQIIKGYVGKYPKLIKAYCNETNIGIFRNINKIRTFPVGDVVSIIAGDDTVVSGLFDSLNDVIKRNNLNGQLESFILITNSISRFINERDIIFSNYHLKSKNLMKARLRYGLSYREIGLSAKLFNSLNPIRLDLGYYADWIYCFEQIEKAEKFYFINKPLSIYYMGIGVSSKNIKELYTSKRKVLDLISIKYQDKFDFLDRLYISFEKSKIDLILNYSILNLFICNFLLIINFFNFSKNYSFFINFREVLVWSIPKRFKLFIKKMFANL